VRVYCPLVVAALLPIVSWYAVPTPEDMWTDGLRFIEEAVTFVTSAPLSVVVATPPVDTVAVPTSRPRPRERVRRSPRLRQDHD
jgi:hypothetical protein